MAPKESFISWLAFQKGEQLAQRIFEVTGSFAKEEKYSLTDQIRRSSRSVCSNLGEAHTKRHYAKHFYAKLTDAIGENNETLVWLRFSRRCNYLNDDEYTSLANLNPEVGKLLSFMLNNPEKFGLHQRR